VQGSANRASRAAQSSVAGRVIYGSPGRRALPRHCGDLTRSGKREPGAGGQSAVRSRSLQDGISTPRHSAAPSSSLTHRLSGLGQKGRVFHPSPQGYPQHTP
jgi:hypothetical protein